MIIKEITAFNFNSENITIALNGYEGRYFQLYMNGLYTPVFDLMSEFVPVTVVNDQSWPTKYVITVNGTSLNIARDGDDLRDKILLINYDNDNVKQAPEIRQGFYDIGNGVTAITLSGDTGSAAVTVTSENRRGPDVELVTEGDISGVGANPYVVNITVNGVQFSCMEAAEVQGQSVWINYIVVGYTSAM